MFCKFDDEDRVLAREPHEHYQSDLRKNVVIAAFEPHAGDGEEQAHRHDQNDGQRKSKTLVLGGQHEEHQQDTERINIQGSVAGQDALIRQLGPFERRPLRQVCVGELRDQCLRLAGTEPGRGSAIDFRRGISVVAHRPVGSVGFRHLY